MISEVRIEKFWQWLSRRMPKKLIYFCTIRLIAHATTRKYSRQIVPELNAMEALKRWEKHEKE